MSKSEGEDSDSDGLVSVFDASGRLRIADEENDDAWIDGKFVEAHL